MVVVVLNEKFKKMWREGNLLACPLLKEFNHQWLSPIGVEVCKMCPCRTCHNYGREFDEIDRLIVPKTPMPELLKEHIPMWLVEWGGDKRVSFCYEDVKRWFEERDNCE